MDKSKHAKSFAWTIKSKIRFVYVSGRILENPLLVRSYILECLETYMENETCNVLTLDSRCLTFFIRAIVQFLFVSHLLTHNQAYQQQRPHS